MERKTTFTVLGAVSLGHFLNDMMQSLLLAIYPTLKAAYTLSFAQLGWVTLAYQVTASLLQPAIGWYADRRAMPYSLPAGTLFTCAGLAVLATARDFTLLLVGAAFLGVGSSVFHPESSRVARAAAGGRFGLAQSVFQVGGNLGTAFGPLCAALIVVPFGQSSLLGFALLTLFSTALLWKVGRWYAGHQSASTHVPAKRESATTVRSRTTVVLGVLVLLIVIFSKYVYVASLSSYFTFYLMQRFGLSLFAAQMHLFAFLAAMAAGTLAGGPLGDRFGRRGLIVFSVLGVLPFTLVLPYASLFWAGVLSAVIGFLIAASFPAIVVFGQELVPGKVGTVSGLLFGFSFGVASIGAASMGQLADHYGVQQAFKWFAFLPLIGVVALYLPKLTSEQRG